MVKFLECIAPHNSDKPVKRGTTLVDNCLLACRAPLCDRRATSDLRASLAYKSLRRKAYSTKNFREAPIAKRFAFSRDDE
ncbi:hypothetical protein D918_08469 [Trichuris suis]|nr:hypothetical protein D918_08469 [Trichuris suis]